MRYTLLLLSLSLQACFVDLGDTGADSLDGARVAWGAAARDTAEADTAVEEVAVLQGDTSAMRR